jgi:molybdate transport system substrate-binding protein
MNGTRFANRVRIAAALALAVALTGCAKKKSDALLCYVGGTMRPAIEKLAKIYEQETGQAIEIDTADSGQLLIKIEQTGEGDLYVCHDPFAASLRRKGLHRQVWTVAALTPVIAVREGNPLKIQGLRDLAENDQVKSIGVTDRMYSTLGHIFPVMFRKAGLTEELEAKIDTEKRMGGEIAHTIELGHLDAGFVWNAVVAAREDQLDAVDIEREYRPHPDVDAVTTATFGYVDMSCVKVTIATLACSKRAKADTAFAEFVNSARGREVFESLAFSPSPYPPATGPLHFYCGAGIRRAAEAAVEQFSAMTAVEIDPDYRGSETLLFAIKLSKSGDLYMPGDIDYIRRAEAEGIVKYPREVCYFIPVILVRKDCDKRIEGLRDLVEQDIRLGLGDPRACAIGDLTQRIFEKNGIPLRYEDHVDFAAPTVNALGVQIQTSQCDAVIVWDAIARQFTADGTIVKIPREQNLISHVAIGVLEASQQPELARSFVDFLASKQGKLIFQDHGFTTSLEDE